MTLSSPLHQPSVHDVRGGNQGERHEACHGDGLFHRVSVTRCPHSNNPAACLALYRLRTSRLVHSWETVPCTTCRYLRINGELVPRPVADSSPFIGQSPKRVCSECGGKVGPSNKSGVCGECIQTLYGNKRRRSDEVPLGAETRGRLAREKCVNGHTDWGFKRNGERYCKTCNKVRLRKLRADQPKKANPYREKMGRIIEYQKQRRTA